MTTRRYFCYVPEGVDHADFTGIAGNGLEDCLKQYVDFRDNGFCHPRHGIIVATASFDDDGRLIEADGISPET